MTDMIPVLEVTPMVPSSPQESKTSKRAETCSLEVFIKFYGKDFVNWRFSIYLRIYRFYDLM